MTNGISGFVDKARRLVKNEEYKAAIATLGIGLDKDPNDRVAQEMLGVLLFRLKRTEEAAGAFQQLTRLDPGDPGAWVNLGAALNVLKDYEAASDALRKAIRRDKACGVAYYNLAIAKKGQNQPAMAVSAYEECLRLEPANTQAALSLVNMLIEQKSYRKASKIVKTALENAPEAMKLQRLQSHVEAKIKGSQQEEPPFGRLVDEKELQSSQKKLVRRKLSRTDRNREREFMRETARTLRHAVRPMVPILDETLPKYMHTFLLASVRPDAQNEAFTAFEGLVSTISELTSMREAVSESVMEIQSHLEKTDPEP